MQNKKTLVTNMCNIQKNIIILHNSMKKGLRGDANTACWL